MKKTITFAQRSLVAGAVLAMTAGMVSAQTVTLFGRVDAGIQYTSKSTASVSGDDGLWQLQNGGILPSIWGMRGTEDLGGGLKAVFNLESDFSADTGGSRGLGNISNALFGRQANVGLSGGWGTVLLGRQYSPALLAELGTDPRGYKESLSSLGNLAANQLPAGNDLTGPNNGAGIFISNLVSYSGTFGPVGVGVGYGLGEGNAGQGDGRTVSLGVSYKGPVVVSLSYQQIEGAPDAEAKRFGVGVAVPFGALTFKALYARATQDDLTGEEVGKTDNLGVGLDFRWSPQSTATLAYYYGEDDVIDDNKTKTLVVSNDYALSKRTILYAQLAYVDADDDSRINTQITLGATPAGEKSTIVGIGIMHNF
ncbi:porin [Methylibium sp.]|uniref:porin n=1 Tax=Methylibium sp. TaxID=2067992 RepID=UPI001790EF08|nr:porin [Methylibium sp.]MBA3589315.1 porin [Methylibium sp.]